MFGWILLSSLETRSAWTRASLEFRVPITSFDFSGMIVDCLIYLWILYWLNWKQREGSEVVWGTSISSKSMQRCLG